MLSPADLERLITKKRHEIEKEKIDLGLTRSFHHNVEENKENRQVEEKRLQLTNDRVLTEHNYVNVNNNEKLQGDEDRSSKDSEEEIPAGLERYIRRCTGLPVMLKAGEYSPNNPLIRGERSSGDVLLGLGEYERRRNTLRRLRQQQYREYLDQQAKLKQEAKEKEERERREREERDRAREEEERRRLEEENTSPVRRRTSLNYGLDVSCGSNNTYITKVDTGVQVDNLVRPLSVAVQTDDVGLYAKPQICQKLTQAERELSPRVSGEQRWTEENWNQWKIQERRRSYGDFDECSATMKKTNKDKLTNDLRHTYMPSIFDADAIQLRNLQAEKEAAARRQYYQQELKNQIQEQQRIREERKTREKMLEEAEMRRLEEQLRALKSAQQHESMRQIKADNAMKEHLLEYEKKRNLLQKEIDKERQTLIRSTSQYKQVPREVTCTSHSEKNPPKQPLYNQNKITAQKPPYSINIPENSIFSPNYDVESYLRKNLNPSRESLISNSIPKANRLDSANNTKIGTAYTNDNKNSNEIYSDNKHFNQINYSDNKNNNGIREKVLIHAQPKRNMKEDSLPIPILKHSPIAVTKDVNDNTELSQAMQMVDDKWRVPAVQKNILKTLPNEEGGKVNILTQLGSIRRQLQLEQMKLDNMVPKDEDV